MQYRVVCPEGTARVVRSQGEVSFDETGRPIRMVSTVQDVTRKKREAEERGKLSIAVEQANDLVMITDRQGFIEYVNTAVTSTSLYFVGNY